jgi:hypothetical protein
MVPGNGVDTEEAWDLEKVELIVAGLWDSVSSDVGVHVIELLLLLSILTSLIIPQAISSAFIISRIELFVIKLTLLGGLLRLIIIQAITK